MKWLLLAIQPLICEQLSLHIKDIFIYLVTQDLKICGNRLDGYKYFTIRTVDFHWLVKAGRTGQCQVGVNGRRNVRKK